MEETQTGEEGDDVVFLKVVDRNAEESVSSTLTLTLTLDYLFVVDKPPGRIVHPTRNSRADKGRTVVELLELSMGWLHPCHRLDRDTSGILVFSKVVLHTCIYGPYINPYPDYSALACTDILQGRGDDIFSVLQLGSAHRQGLSSLGERRHRRRMAGKKASLGPQTDSR